MPKRTGDDANHLIDRVGVPHPPDFATPVSRVPTFPITKPATSSKHLIYLFRERFRWEPYHVQLVMLDSVGYARIASQELKDRLIESICALEVSPGNWGISSSIVDALKILGALDQDAEDSRTQVKAEIASALVDDGSSVDCDLALALCVKMFDHPYDSVYAEEIYDLDEGLRRRLYRRAIQASSVGRSMSA